MSTDQAAANESLAREKMSLEIQVESLQRECRQYDRRISEMDGDYKDRITTLQEANEKLTKELSEARGRQAPLHADMESLRGSLSRTSEELESVKKLRAELVSQLEKSMAELATAQSNAREAARLETVARASYDSEKSKNSTLSSNLSSVQAELAAREEELRAVTHRMSEAQAQLLEAREAAANAEKDRDALATEIEGLVAARANDRGEFEARLNEAREDIRQLAAEAREKEKRAALEYAKKTEEVVAARKEAELATERFEAQARELAALLEETKSSSVRSSQNWQAEKANLEKQIQQLRSQLNTKQGEGDKIAADLTQRILFLEKELDSLRTRASNREAEARTFISSLEVQLKELNGEYATILAEKNALATRVKALSFRIEQQLGASSPIDTTLSAWSEEVKAAFRGLIDRIHFERRKADEHKNQTRLAETAHEELRARLLLAEEALSRASHDAMVKAQTLEQVKEDLRNQQSISEKEHQAASVLNDELQAELARLKDKLTHVNRDKLRAQDEVKRLEIEVEEMRTSHTQRNVELESRISELNIKVTELSTQLDEATVKEGGVTSVLSTKNQEIEKLKKEKSALEAAAKTASAASRSAIEGYKAQIAGLLNSLNSLEKQVASTNSMLAVYKEQKAVLMETNANLRAELDAYYAQALHGSAIPVPLQTSAAGPGQWSPSKMGMTFDTPGIPQYSMASASGSMGSFRSTVADFPLSLNSNIQSQSQSSSPVPRALHQAMDSAVYNSPQQTIQLQQSATEGVSVASEGADANAESLKKE